MVNQLIVGQFLKSAKGTIAIPSVTFDNYLVSGLLIWPPSIICEAEIDLAGCALHPISAGEKKNQFEWKEEWLRPDHTYVYSLLLVNEWSVFLLCLKCRHNQPVYLCAKHCIRWQPLGTVGETVWSWTFLRDRNAVNCHTFGQNEFIKCMSRSIRLDANTVDHAGRQFQEDENVSQTSGGEWDYKLIRRYFIF